MLPEIDINGQELIKKSRVLLIGLGGLGSPISMYLAAAGVGELVLVDFDKVDLTNLQRQILHRTKDIDRFKTDSAKEHLHELNPDISVCCIGKKLSEKLDRADAHPYGLRPFSRSNYIKKFITLTKNIVSKKESERFLKNAQNLMKLKSGQLNKLNIEIRKFLKKVGITSQREIENYIVRNLLKVISKKEILLKYQ